MALPSLTSQNILDEPAHGKTATAPMGGPEQSDCVPGLLCGMALSALSGPQATGPPHHNGERALRCDVYYDGGSHRHRYYASGYVISHEAFLLSGERSPPSIRGRGYGLPLASPCQRDMHTDQRLHFIPKMPRTGLRGTCHAQPWPGSCNCSSLLYSQTVTLSVADW